MRPDATEVGRRIRDDAHTMTDMTRVRPPAVAGTFYPADAARLDADVREMLAAATPAALDIDLRMLIVPHAGYVYSGPVAASAYALLPGRGFRWVVLVGPSHFVRFEGLALPDAARFATPLGEVPVDEELAAAAEAFAHDRADAHAREHSLEVQLPFLQTCLEDFAFVPVLTGDDDPEPTAGLLDDVLDIENTLVVVSSDLSHYEDYATAQRLDAATADAIVELRADDVGPASACGRTAIRGALKVAQRRGWACRLIDLRSSGDTTGDRDRVVGYGVFVIGPVHR